MRNSGSRIACLISNDWSKRFLAFFNPLYECADLFFEGENSLELVPVGDPSLMETVYLESYEMSTGPIARFQVPRLDGDLNSDRIIDIVDLNMVLIDWGHSGEEIIEPASDANGDGTIDIVDLNTVLIDWGKTW